MSSGSTVDVLQRIDAISYPAEGREKARKNAQKEAGKYLAVKRLAKIVESRDGDCGGDFSSRATVHIVGVGRDADEVNSTQLDTTQLNSTRLDSGQLNSTELVSTQLSSMQFNLSQLNLNQLN